MGKEATADVGGGIGLGHRSVVVLPTPEAWHGEDRVHHPAHFSNIGITKAAVFPEPVRAMAATSTPWMMRGIALRWMGVGRR